MFHYLCIAAIAVALCNGQAAPEPVRNPICTHRSGFYLVEGSCDSYIECKDYIAHEMICPDGLHFNPAASWPSYPCGYPTDISCEGRGAPQPPIATEECPHQYGFFPSPSAAANECGQYRMCVEGRAIEMVCPPGLAYNPEMARCDWPDLVATCNADSFLGFKCPELPLGENGEMSDLVVNYKYEGNCFAFYSCERGHARLLTCDPGFAFDTNTGHCQDAEKVGCSN